MVKGMHASILPGCKCPWTPQETDCYGDGNVYRGVRSKDSFNPGWNTEAVLVEEMQRMAKRIEELEALAQPEQKYHRGDRLICLETEEYCVIHISGTDRQWVKFPDSHIGVYTNEQVAELFELLPKEPKQETVAWMNTENFVDDGNLWDLAVTKLRQQQESIEGLNRDYDLLFAEHQLLLKKEWVGLTDEEIEQGCKESWVTEQAFQSAVWWAEDKLKDKNTKGQE